MPADDPYLPLAFSLASSPGSYAVLADAGVSKGAGLPSAWDIEVDLVRQIAQRDNAAITIDDSNAEEWYSDNYGKALTYSSVIEELGDLRAADIDAFHPRGSAGTTRWIGTVGGLRRNMVDGREWKQLDKLNRPTV